MLRNGVELNAVYEYANLAAFPAIGEPDTIYIAVDTSLIYRWTGSAYVVLSKAYFDDIYQPKNAGWVAWTPTFTNLTIGDGMYSASYTVDPITKLTHGKITVIFSATSVMGSQPRFTLPSTPHAQYTAFDRFGTGQSSNAANSSINQNAPLYRPDIGANVVEIYTVTSPIYAATTATAPFTWATGSKISIEFFYRAA